jgi:hypothetical protein
MGRYDTDGLYDNYSKADGTFDMSKIDNWLSDQKCGGNDAEDDEEEADGGPEYFEDDLPEPDDSVVGKCSDCDCQIHYTEEYADDAETGKMLCEDCNKRVHGITVGEEQTADPGGYDVPSEDE